MSLAGGWSYEFFVRVLIFLLPTFLFSRFHRNYRMFPPLLGSMFRWAGDWQLQVKCLNLFCDPASKKALICKIQIFQKNEKKLGEVSSPKRADRFCFFFILENRYLGNRHEWNIFEYSKKKMNTYTFTHFY